ncbi:Papain family cysteine protease [Gimesia maris]|uniref:C1 family peptidase n=1 Tax=Gimesia maris TaxID=122 RepID=UPI00118A405E|nr:C1 family peptidase [Gimesia maris]QDT78254.1 Papain family cysteine protease [Gimesia maris]
MSRIENLKRGFPGMTDREIEILADHGLVDAQQVKDIAQGMDNSQGIFAALLNLSPTDLLNRFGWDEWPIHSGVTVAPACYVGGVFKTDDTEQQSMRCSGRRRVSLPNHVSLVKYFGPPRSQGKIGTCTAFATIAMEEGQLKNPSIDLSETFVYANTKAHDGHPESDGSWLRVSTQMLDQFGVCLEKTLPYRQNRTYLRCRPPSAAFKEAQKYRPSKRLILGAKDVNQIKEELYAGRPVGLSLPIFASNHNSLRFHSEGRFTMRLGIFDRLVGGHAVCAVAYVDNDWLKANGFEDEIGSGAFLIRNSWGEWAHNNKIAQHFGANSGYGIVPYRFVQEYCWEAISVTARSSQWSKKLAQHAPTLAATGRNWWKKTRHQVVAQAEARLYGTDY